MNLVPKDIRLIRKKDSGEYLDGGPCAHASPPRSLSIWSHLPSSVVGRVLKTRVSLDEQTPPRVRSLPRARVAEGGASPRAAPPTPGRPNSGMAQPLVLLLLPVGTIPARQFDPVIISGSERTVTNFRPLQRVLEELTLVFVSATEEFGGLCAFSGSLLLLFGWFIPPLT